MRAACQCTAAIMLLPSSLSPDVFNSAVICVPDYIPPPLEEALWIRLTGEKTTIVAVYTFVVHIARTWAGSVHSPNSLTSGESPSRPPGVVPLSDEGNKK